MNNDDLSRHLGAIAVDGFTTPAPDLALASGRETELTTGWLDSLSRYRSIEEGANHD